MTEKNHIPEEILPEGDAKINIDGYQIVFSGHVIIPKQINEFFVTLPDSVEGDYSFTFRFHESEEKDQIYLEPTDTHHVIFNFYCQKGSDYSGNEFIPIGTLKNKKLFFNFRRFDMKNVGMILFYNFLQVNEEEEGNKNPNELGERANKDKK